MTNNLKVLTVNGIFWSFFERIGQQIIQFSLSIFLARLLLPEQYGIIAMISIFLTIAGTFIDSGYGSALIQKKHSSYIDECSIFYFNIFLSFIAVLILWFSAPYIANFYKLPLLIPIIKVLSLGLIINAFSLIHNTLLNKKIDFKTQFKISSSSTIISGGIGLFMAYKGYGVWSLVTQSLISTFVRTILLWYFVNWTPTLLFSFHSLNTMFSFGSKILISSLIDKSYNNLLPLLIGKLFTPIDLGFYTRANQLQQLPVDTISSSFVRVMYPIFSSIQDDKPRLKKGMRKLLSNMAMINFPLMMGLAVIAKPLVTILLTEKWLPCVPYLQLLSAIGLMYPFHLINVNILMAQGRSDLFLRLEIIKKFFGIIFIIFTYQKGILGMIEGQIASSFICYFINTHYTKKLLNYSVIEQIRDLLPSFILSLFMCALVYSITSFEIENQLTLLTLQIFSGILFYMIFCRVTKLKAYMELLYILKLKLAN